MTDLNLDSLLRLLHASSVIEERLAGEFSAVHGLSVKEAFLLMQLERAPLQRLPRVELAKRLHASASTVTRMAAPMEKLGLVSRETDSRDARLAFVVLTDAGLCKINEVRATFSKHAAYAFKDRWTDQEIRQLHDLLARLVVGAPGDLT